MYVLRQVMVFKEWHVVVGYLTLSHSLLLLENLTKPISFILHLTVQPFLVIFMFFKLPYQVFPLSHGLEQQAACD